MRGSLEHECSVARLDSEGDGFAAADAEAGDAAAAAGALERVQKRDEHAGPAAADRMPERHGPAVDVDSFGRDAELAFGDHRHDGEGLVDLEEVDLLDRPVDLLEEQPDRGDGGGGEPFGLLAPGGRTLDLGERLELRGAAALRGCDQKRGRPVADAGSVSGRDRAVGAERRLERAKLGFVELRRAFVLGDDAALSFPLDETSTGTISVSKTPLGDRLAGAGVASDGEIVLLGAG